MARRGGLVLLAALCACNALVAPRSLAPRRPLTPRRVAEIVPASYDLALGTLALGGVFALPKRPPKLPVAFFSAFGAFLFFQTTALRFEFTEDAFSLINVSSGKAGDNVVVGGTNSWKTSTFSNWAFLPSEKFPILVYFRETQTPEADRVDAPIVVDDAPGQAHFFPAISNVQRLKEGFQQRGCTKL